MLRITPDRAYLLFDIAATRRLEQAAAAQLPPHALMQRAGLATAKLALALAPHARSIWIACGPGNNGGDGLEAAMHLQRWSKQTVVTWLGDEAIAPADSLAALARATQAGVRFAPEPPTDLAPQDLCIDALLGIGASRAPQGRMARWIDALGRSAATVLAVDVPSGLNPDTGVMTTTNVADSVDSIRARGTFHAQYTLCLLTLKPGLFTAHGRDAAGHVWFDDLGVDSAGETPAAMLSAPPAPEVRFHATHKGSYGDVAVIGGAPGMTGAALLAGTAALHGGAGRVFVALLDAAAPSVDMRQPELMLRSAASLDLKSMVVVCGCGGGDAVRHELARVISTAAHAVLDADALNAIATDTQLQTPLRARAGNDGADAAPAGSRAAARHQRSPGAGRPSGRCAATGGTLRLRGRAQGFGHGDWRPQADHGHQPDGQRAARYGGHRRCAGRHDWCADGGGPVGVCGRVRSCVPARTGGRPVARGPRPDGRGTCHQGEPVTGQPRPANGILVAITVWNITFAVRGRLAM